MPDVRLRFRRPRRTVLVAASLVAVLLVGAAAAVVWWAGREVPPPWGEPRPPAVGWTGVVTTLAGDGGLGVVDAPFGAARFDDPYGVAVGRDGVVYVADGGNANRVRRLGPSGVVTTLAGGAFEGQRDGSGMGAAFHTPSGLAVDASGAVLVADAGNHAIRRVGSDGRVTTVAGGGAPGWLDGPPGLARFDGPLGVAVDATGRLFVADTYNDAVRVVSHDGIVTTLAGGGGRGFVDGPVDVARFDTPADVAVSAEGVVWVADTGNHALRRISPDGMVETVPVDLWRPLAVASGPSGSVYVGDSRGRIVQVEPGGVAHVLAGSTPGYADGSGPVARFSLPTGIAVDASGALLVADTGNRVVRRIAPAVGIEPRPTHTPRRPRLDAASLGLGALGWPLRPHDLWHEVAGTVGEPRGDWVDPRRRFHAGLDVVGARGTPVVAVRDEKAVVPIPVSSVGTVNESLALQVFTYVHMTVGRDPRGRPTTPAFALLERDDRGRVGRVRVRRGTRVGLAEVLGTTNAASHVHLETGPRGGEMNTLALPIAGFSDSVPPTIEPGGIRLYTEAGAPLGTSRDERIEVFGRVRVEVEAYDQVDDNLPRRKLGLARLGYQVLDAEGTPLAGWERPRVTIDLEYLPTATDASQFVYALGSGIAGGGQRVTRFIYVVTNVVRDDLAREAFWDTSTLVPGEYVLRILAEDRDGNRAISSRDVRLVVR